MIGSPFVRILIVAALFPLTYWGAKLVKVAIEPPLIDMPAWTFNDMPMQMGEWRGENTALDPKIAVATDAKIIVNREYRDNAGHSISLHTAVFDKPAEGVFHSPINCYRTNGFEDISQTQEMLRINDGLTIPVNVSLWKRNHDKVMVVYWYQLGEHVLFGRWDLGVKVRWSLAGKPKWPALIKVMMQIPVADAGDAKTAIMGFAEQVAKWENEPIRRNGKGMLGTQVGAAGGKPSAPP